MTARCILGFWVMVVASWAGNALANGGAGHDDPEVTIFKVLIVPFGLVTIFSVLTTVTLGLKMASNRATIFPWHRRMALTTAVLALCHATLVIFFH